METASLTPRFPGSQRSAREVLLFDVEMSENGKPQAAQLAVNGASHSVGSLSRLREKGGERAGGKDWCVFTLS